MKKFKAQAIINIVAIILLTALFISLYFIFKDKFDLLNTKEGLENFINDVQNTGFLGGIILVVIQILQVVVAFIPGEFVELASGIMFGPVLGLVLCLIGLNIGTIIIFGLVKLLGKPFVDENVSDKNQKFLFLNNSNRTLIILFFIFLIPGIPKDILIYLVPLTKVKMWQFLIVSSVSRIPSILTSTIAGTSIINGDYLVAGIIMGISLILAIIGLIFNKQITNYIENKVLKK